MSVFIGNPVLGKELTQRFSLRRQSRANRVAIVVTTALLVPLLYYFCLRSMFLNPGSAKDFYAAWLMAIELSVVVLMAPALLAGAITIEREKQTWNALLLSRLTHGQITIGKLLGGMVPAGIALGLFLPITLTSALIGSIPLSTFLLTHGVLLLTLLLCASIGLFCSWACRRTQVALSVSAVCVAMLVLGSFLAFLLCQTALSGSGMGLSEWTFVPLWTNPYFVMMCLLNDQQTHSADTAAITLAYSVFAALVSALLLAIATRRLARGPKEMVD
jgi:ABC-type transport system involved in multi-copper enzyme maturation permease subunit